MTFTVEDGTGITNANSLCAVNFADSYFTDRAIAGWTGTNDAKQSALIRATDYIETRFGPRFKGSKADEDQALSWPRVEVCADDTVPVAVRKATAEYALRALTAVLLPDPVYDDSGRLVASKSEKVGPISETVTYITGTGVVIFRAYPAADALLKPWLKSSSGLVRA